jgi:hypothetical protein
MNKIFNRGDGSVSRLCNGSMVVLAVLNNLMAPFISSGQMMLLTYTINTGADVTGDGILGNQLAYLQHFPWTIKLFPW